MNMKKTYRWYRPVAVALLLAAFHPALYAADEPVRLDIQVRAGLPGGVVKDGTRLATGRISHTENHTGFHVWSLAAAVPGKPGVYVLDGTGYANNGLRVRLQGTEWRDAQDGRGLALLTDRGSASLDVVADGDQMVKADNWRLQLQGAVLLPDASGDGKAGQ